MLRMHPYAHSVHSLAGHTHLHSDSLSDIHTYTRMHTHPRTHVSTHTLLLQEALCRSLENKKLYCILSSLSSCMSSSLAPYFAAFSLAPIHLEQLGFCHERGRYPLIFSGWFRHPLESKKSCVWHSQGENRRGIFGDNGASDEMRCRNSRHCHDRCLFSMRYLFYSL